MALVSAYGQTGPYRQKGGFDRTIAAFSGNTYVTGYPDSPPVRPGYAQIDYMTSYLGAFGVMLALYNRDVNNSGGEVIDLSLAEAAFRCSESALIEYSMNGTVRERVGNRNLNFVPAEDFETSDGKILVINAGTDRLWYKLAHAMKQPELLEDERFNNTVNRIANQNALNRALLCDWIGQCMLILYFVNDMEKLRSSGIRTILDLQECALTCDDKECRNCAKIIGLQSVQLPYIKKILQLDYMKVRMKELKICLESEYASRYQDELNSGNIR